MLNQLERIRGFFGQVTGTTTDKSEQVSVIIFGSEKEYLPYRVNAVASAYYSKQSDHDFIVVGKLGEESSQIASHEYTHLAFAHAGYSLPPWLNEGIAELFSTLSAHGDHTLFGGVLPGRLQELDREPWVPLQVILAVDKKSPYYNETNKAGIFYDESWALVHMLATSDEYRARFWDVVKAVNAGMPSADALEKTYGVPLAKLEDAVQAYVSGSRYNQLKVKVALEGTEKLASQPADLFEVRELQAALLMGLRGKQGEARTRFEQLTREDGARPGPWADLGYLAWRGGDEDKAVEYFGKAFDLGNRRPRLLLDYARLVAPSNQKRAVAVLWALLVVEPANIDARLFLGGLLMSLDEPAEARAAVRPIRSVQTPEQRDNLLYLRAQAAMRLEDFVEARSNADQLRSVTTSESMRTQADDILREAEQH
jgi:Flp pilus assembly protein TadD